MFSVILERLELSALQNLALYLRNIFYVMVVSWKGDILERPELCALQNLALSWKYFLRNGECFLKHEEINTSMNYAIDLQNLCMSVEGRSNMFPK